MQRLDTPAAPARAKARQVIRWAATADFRSTQQFDKPLLALRACPMDATRNGSPLESGFPNPQEKEARSCSGPGSRRTTETAFTYDLAFTVNLTSRTSEVRSLALPTMWNTWSLTGVAFASALRRRVAEFLSPGMVTSLLSRMTPDGRSFTSRVTSSL